jgi:hypothetical protein
MNIFKKFFNLFTKSKTASITMAGSFVVPPVINPPPPIIKENKNKDCVILVPCNGGIEFKTDEALRVLESRGYEVWRNPYFSAIDQGRNRLAFDALYNRNFKELLWIDSDIAFNPDDVERIRSHNQPIVAAAYPFKNWPVMTVQPLKDDVIEFGCDGKLVEVMCAATGFLYTKAEVYYNIKEKLNLPICNTSFGSPQVPFFQPGIWEWDGLQYYLGEDFSYCLRARKCNYKILLDTGISLGHIGKYTFTIEDVINKTGQVPKPNTGTTLIYK